MENLNNYNLYIHRVVTDDNGPMYYVGVTIDNKRRWKPSEYRLGSLWPYIEKYGWDNIEHNVVVEGLDYETALELEDTLILLYRTLGRGINKQRSGLISKDSAEYVKNLYHNNNDYAEQKRLMERERYHNKKASDLEWYERKRQYERDKGHTPEGKIYKRVSNFNRCHPDRIVETPLEAKKRYLEQHIIPDYIKNNDLK